MPIIAALTINAVSSLSALAQNQPAIEAKIPAEDIREFSPYEMTLVEKILKKAGTQMSKDDYLEFRKYWIELMISNRNRTAKLLKAALVSMPIGKFKPGTNHIWDASPDLNLAILFRIIARENGIQLSDIELSDFDAKIAGASSNLSSSPHYTKNDVSFLIEIRNLFNQK